jgi:hypothetical protein
MLKAVTPVVALRCGLEGKSSKFNETWNVRFWLPTCKDRA